MNQIATQPLTAPKLLPKTQSSTNLPIFTIPSSPDTLTTPTFKELLDQYQATINQPNVTSPFAIYHNNLAHASPQPVNWLWQKRLPLASITILDGDHACGKSLLTLQIAASVSSGTPMPDGTSTLQGGVVIITPHTDSHTTQLQTLTDLGADLSCIEVLSCVQDPKTSHNASGHRPFSLPQDFSRLFQAIERVNARLIIFDPFISLLSRDHRWTDRRLGHLLADLRLYLIEHNIACLLTRNCHAKGGQARPTLLERSDHFASIAASRLLLAPDPFQPDRLLLSHARSRHVALTPTSILHIQSQSSNPDLPHITILGTHTLQAKDLINSRPNTLHRQLLTQHLLQIITQATDPIPVATLYAASPHSSTFQIQRAIADLLHRGHIERPTRGFYTLAHPPTQPDTQLKSSAATTPITQFDSQLKSSAATTPIVQPNSQLKPSAATTQIPQPDQQLKSSAAITPIVQPNSQLKSSAATTLITQPDTKLKPSAVTTHIAQPDSQLKPFAATTQIPQSDAKPKSSAATTQIPQPDQQLKTSATTTLIAQPNSQLKPFAATTPIAQPDTKLKPSAATTPIAQPDHQLKSSAATTPIAQPDSQLKPSAAITLKPKAAKNSHKGHSGYKQTKNKRRH